jgi:phage baseplate assembly protein V
MDDPNFPYLAYGTIASVDLAAARITVRVGEIETQPIRWSTGAAGGTQIWIRPKVGEQVLLMTPEGDIEAAIAYPGVTFDAFPPIADPDRDVIRFEDGATVAYNPGAGQLEVTLPGGGTIKLLVPAGVEIQGDVKIQGKLDVTGDVVGAGVSLKNHMHDKTQPGGGVSGKPVAA